MTGCILPHAIATRHPANVLVHISGFSAAFCMDPCEIKHSWGRCAAQVAREALTSYLKLVQQVLTAAADREAAAAIARLTSAPSAAELRGQDSSAGAASSQGENPEFDQVIEC